MANEEHLQRLKAGVESWNEWTRTNWPVKPNLSQADLSRLNLSGVSLGGVNLGRANLYRATLRRGALNSARLIEANLGEADLSQIEGGWADFSQANLHQANLVQAVLRQANFSGADLREADLSQANLRKANLKGADLRRAKLYRADLRQADLSDAILEQATLTRTLYDEATRWPTGFTLPASVLRSSPFDIKIRVNNLPPHTTAGDLAEFFHPYGEIMSVNIPADRRQDTPGSVGFIEMRREEGAQAVRALNGQSFNGAKLHIHQVARILTVDDDMEMRLLVELILTGKGYQLEFADSGEQALQQMRRVPPDVCLLDIMMPGLDGYEVYAEMKADQQLAEVGVILITSRTSCCDCERTRGWFDNKDAFIAKPFVIEDLFKNIKTVLGNYGKSHLAVE